MRLVILRAKGGVGGSSVSLSLAKYYALIGKKVLLVDSDAISTASSAFGLKGLGLIQLAKRGESYEKAVTNVSIGKGSITVLKIMSDGVPVEYERMDLLTNKEKITKAYLQILERDNYDVTIVDTFPVVTPLEAIVGWEYSTYTSKFKEKSKYIMVSEPSKPSLEATERYYNILRENNHIANGIDVAILNKVDVNILSYNEIFSILIDYMDRVNSNVGAVLPYEPRVARGLENIVSVAVPVQLMEVGHYLLNPSKGRKVIIPKPGDEIKTAALLDATILLKANIRVAEESIRDISNKYREVYPNSSIFLFTSTGTTTQTTNVIVFRSIFTYLSERTKVKTLDDAIRIAKRLALEIIDEVKKHKFEKNVLVFYPSDDIEPVSEYCDRALLAKTFWNELLLQLMFSLEKTSVIVVCNPMKANCSPLEDLVDFVIEATYGPEGMKYQLEYSKFY